MPNKTNKNKRISIKEQLKTSAKVKKDIIEECLDDIQRAAEVMNKAIKAGGKIFFCGNGGSAADSQHLAAELVVKLNTEREAIPALALTTDSSIITAESNDVGFVTVFKRQLEALADTGDVVVGISTSGNSTNVIKALEYCHKNDITTIGLTGGKGGKLKTVAQYSVIIPTSNTQRIQEGHITVGHIFCDLIEREVVKNC